jgi:hypothetical protein
MDTRAEIREFLTSRRARLTPQTAGPAAYGSIRRRFPRTGLKRLHHPGVGDLELTYEALELPADPGLLMFVHGAEPGTPSSDGLRMLASLHPTDRVTAPSPTD